MFETPVKMDTLAHSGWKIRRAPDFRFARRATNAPLTAAEMPLACRDLPIVFPSSGRLVPTAQLGVKKRLCAVIGDTGQWRARYIPAHIRRYPFVLGETGAQGDYIVMIASEALVEEGDGEVAFLDGKMPEGGVVEKGRDFLIGFEQALEKTARLCAPLREHGVLVGRSAELKHGDEAIGRISGFEVVDTDKLHALDGRILAQWVRSGLMQLVDAHLVSLNNFQQLTDWHMHTVADEPRAGNEPETAAD